MLKIKKLEAILKVYNLDGAASDKLNAIACIAANPNNKVLKIFLDPTLDLDQKLEQIHSSVQLTEKTIRKYRKYGQYLGTLCLIIYSFIQTLGLI